MNESICRGCGARIVFIKMVSGKYMPCDLAPVYYKRNPDGPDKIVLECGGQGVVIPGRITKDISEASGAGYRPHWATCPKAENFKGGGGRR